jgi:excisionase family DNA binding protein
MKTTKDDDRWPLCGTVQQVQRYTGWSRAVIYERLRDGSLGAVKSGRRTLVLFDSVRRAVETLPRASFGSAKADGPRIENNPAAAANP